ncbi:MAG: hypothetical protein ACKVOK_04120 [Flavobacteriales bacterium]
MKKALYKLLFISVILSSCDREITLENDPNDISEAVAQMSEFYGLYANSKYDSIWIKYNPPFSKQDFLSVSKERESRIGSIEQVKSKLVKTTSVSNSNGLKKDYIISLEGKYVGGTTEEILTIQIINGKARIIGYSIEKIYEGR